jgi:hypothetical protein
MKKPKIKQQCVDKMEIVLTNTTIFMLGAFVGALVGRMATFGILAVIFLFTLIVK